MSIQIACSLCGTTYNVNPSTIGKRLKCRDCGQAFVAVSKEPLPPRDQPPPVPDWAKKKRVAPLPAIPVAMAVSAYPPLPAIPISGQQPDVNDTPTSPITWLLGVNLFEQIAVGVTIGLLVIALLIGGDAGMITGAALSTLIILYFAFAAYMMARTAGRNGYGIVQMMIPFYIIPFSIEHWPLMKWPVARMARVGGLFVLMTLVLVRASVAVGTSRNSGVYASANSVRGSKSPAVVSVQKPVTVSPSQPNRVPPVAFQPPPQTGAPTDPFASPPPPMQTASKSNEEMMAEARARADVMRQQMIERRRTQIQAEANAAPVPVDAPIAGQPPPPIPNRPPGKAFPKSVSVGPVKLTMANARGMYGSAINKQYWFGKLTPTGDDGWYQIYADAFKEDPNGATVPKLEPGDIIGRQPRYTLGTTSQLDQVEINGQRFTRVRENEVDRCYSGYIDGYRVTVFYVGITTPSAGQNIRQMLETMEHLDVPK